MYETIREEIIQIEIDFNVKVLYACESGSRAWGFPSKDSDYDVRFIYIHQKDWYLSIDQKRDVIELPINNLLDINGWELTKALRLFRKSNPPLLEWLHSSIVYYEAYTVIDKIRKLEPYAFAPTSCLYHYLNMAKGNYRDYLRNDLVKVKKYFYMLRPILACKWIERKNTMPPIEFPVLLEEIVAEGLLKDEINKLLERKIAGEELNVEPRIDVINEFLEKEIIHLEHYVKSLNVEKKDITDKLDTLFRDALDEVW